MWQLKRLKWLPLRSQQTLPRPLKKRKTFLTCLDGTLKTPQSSRPRQPQRLSQTILSHGTTNRHSIRGSFSIELAPIDMIIAAGAVVVVIDATITIGGTSESVVTRAKTPTLASK
jgi:hypothetical protein